MKLQAETLSHNYHALYIQSYEKTNEHKHRTYSGELNLNVVKEIPTALFKNPR